METKTLLDQFGKPVLVTEDFNAAVEVYLRERAEYERLIKLEDAAFARYMAGSNNGSAVSRAGNRANYQSTILYSAEAVLFQMNINPEDVWKHFHGQEEA